MKNLWSDREAQSYIKRYAKQGVNADVALRVYTSRLLGGNPKLVLHGGGNTSVKTSMVDLAGDEVEVLCVKGSGWDMGDIEPAGLPAVRLKPLLKMEKFKVLSDEDMINAQRTNLLDSGSPNPSVETLLHAFLPHKFIDHTHSNAVLALSDQENGDALCQEVFGGKMGYVPYIMPGFALARKAAEVYRNDPSVDGLILLKHGIFTFAETAKDAYSLMISMVSKAERRLAQGKGKIFAQVKLPKKTAKVSDVAPILRGLVEHDGKRMVLEFRTSKEILNYAGGKEVARYSQQGTVTPDHVIRTKPNPLIVPAPVSGKLDVFTEDAGVAVEEYVSDYHAYFSRQNKRMKGIKTELDPMPRMILVPGVGAFGLGNSAKAASIAADLLETNISVITQAEAMGIYSVIPEKDIFEIEYWSLEQAKLGKGQEKPFARQVAVISGGGSGIGAATARAFASNGAEVCVLDRDAKSAMKIAAEIGGLGLACDVTNAKDVEKAFDQIARTYGGVDIAVSNAGAAWQGKIGEVDEKVLRQSFELNFWGHQNIAKNAVRIMRAQGTGGCLLFNTSKQAINPGKDFGPYGLPKAATLFLMKQYALDYGADGIRSNAVNADRIRSGLLTDDFIKTRSKARGVTESDYMSGNLLHREVTAEDVANAFVDLAKAQSTTAAVVTVDGGNIEASLR
jgi:rhamnose utilization protein RhaD (predicted bifunctional aldolase and dehydrogenase)/NAD(P)-dependent dehydrogenase (short-subunit alcohol dehydrogenase family)